MKIGFFGNTNNAPFMLARAVKRMGHEVLFIVSSRERLHRPEFRFDDIRMPYPEWIRDEGGFRARECVIPNRRRARIVNLLKGCDAVVYNGYGPALSPLVARPAIVFLTGSDLDYLANEDTIETVVKDVRRWPIGLRRIYVEKFYTRLVSAQRTGIRNACAVEYFPPGAIPVGDRLLEGIGIKQAQRIFFMMTDLERIPAEPLPRNDPVRLFCAARFTWKRPLAPGTSELDYKGSDVMIKGLGLFRRRARIPLEIRLVKKGRHVREAMELAAHEGLSDQVRWLEEMSQLEVLEEYRHADIILDQFGQSIVGMAGLDAMAMGRPVIANGRPEVMERAIGVPSPICQAATPEEVCGQLERLVPDPVERDRVGLASRNYVEQFFSADHAAEICLDRLRECR